MINPKIQFCVNAIFSICINVIFSICKNTKNSILYFIKIANILKVYCTINERMGITSLHDMKPIIIMILPQPHGDEVSFRMSMFHDHLQHLI